MESPIGHECFHTCNFAMLDDIVIRYLIKRPSDNKLVELLDSHCKKNVCTSEIFKKGLLYTGIEAAWVSWEELFKEENGYIGKDKSLTFAVQLSYMCRTVNPNSLLPIYCIALFNVRDKADFIVKCRDVEIPVHAKVLELHSEFLLKLLNDKKAAANSKVVHMEDVDPAVLKFIEFCYVQLNFKNSKETFYSIEILEMAEKFESQTLLDDAFRMMSCLLTIENVFRAFDVAFRLGFKDLMYNCMGFVVM